MAALLVLLALFNTSARADTLFGGERTLIPVAGHTGFIIQPPQPASGGNKPWAWYAPTFINSYPNSSNGWYFSRLIQKGFYVCGVDLGESYGSPAGRAVCSAFYDTLMARYGLNSKMLLVPQSRGGLMLYNWAADSGNSAKVSRIAGIYPVGDLRSYPGLATAAPAYGMTALELEQHLTENNPIDRLQPLRDAGVKIMHIHGDNDAVVPLSQNSQVIHDRYIGMGGEMTLIVVPGQGHAEIPEFFQSQQMLDFMLAETSATALTFSFDPPHRAVASLDAFFPNPMNTEATVAFSLPAPSVVDLLVLDVSGRAVARLLSGQTAAGSHTVHWNASTLPSGAYFCTLRADGLVKTEKFFLQR